MKIEFTLDQLSVLDKALQQLPYHMAAPLIQSINAQLIEQKKIMDTPLENQNIFPKTHQQSGE
jgi:hypothetical protein